MLSFVDDVITGFLTINLFAFTQLGDDCVTFVILVSSFIRWPGDNQRSARFVDQNRIHLVNYRKIMASLDTGREIKFHVVAQVVEAKFVVGAVSNVGCVSRLALEIVHVVLDTSDFETKEAVNLSHPFSVARSEVVIYGDDVNTAATSQRVEVCRKGCNERLAFTRS